jgi:dipeptide/tripeptide permease
LPRAFALVYTMGSICGIIAPIGYGLLGDAIGIEKTMLIAGGLVLLALPLALVLRSAINNNAVHPSKS